MSRPTQLIMIDDLKPGDDFRFTEDGDRWRCLDICDYTAKEDGDPLTRYDCQACIAQLIRMPREDQSGTIRAQFLGGVFVLKEEPAPSAPGTTSDTMLSAGQMLDAQPVPTEGRQVWLAATHLAQGLCPLSESIELLTKKLREYNEGYPVWPAIEVAAPADLPSVSFDQLSAMADNYVLRHPSIKIIVGQYPFFGAFSIQVIELPHRDCNQTKCPVGERLTQIDFDILIDECLMLMHDKD